METNDPWQIKIDLYAQSNLSDHEIAIALARHNMERSRPHTIGKMEINQTRNVFKIQLLTDHTNKSGVSFWIYSSNDTKVTTIIFPEFM